MVIEKIFLAVFYIWYFCPKLKKKRENKPFLALRPRKVKTVYSRKAYVYFLSIANL